MICWVFVTDFDYADLQNNQGRGAVHPDSQGLIVLSPNSPEEILSSECLT